MTHDLLYEYPDADEPHWDVTIDFRLLTRWESGTGWARRARIARAHAPGGVTYRELGRVLGVNTQRAHALAAEGRASAGRRTPVERLLDPPLDYSQRELALLRRGAGVIAMMAALGTRDPSP